MYIAIIYIIWQAMVRDDQNLAVTPTKAGIQSEPAATHSPFANLKDLLKPKS